MTTSKWHYAKALAEQLRVNGVPEERVREIVAQVESHVEATGEDPVSAFGQPVDYAASWQQLSASRWAWQVLKGASVAVGVVAAGKAVLTDEPWGGGVPVTAQDLATAAVFVVLVALMPWTVDLWLSRRRAARLGEPSYPVEWPYRFMGFLVVGTPVILLSWLLADSVTQPVLTLPRWLLLASGLVGISVGLFDTQVPGNAGHPRPPWAGKESWLARVRRVLG